MSDGKDARDCKVTVMAERLISPGPEKDGSATFTGRQSESQFLHEKRKGPRLFYRRLGHNIR